MPAKIETLKCNAAEILVEPFVPGTVRGSSLLLFLFLFCFIVYFFFFVFFLTDVLFVLQKAKRPGWSLSHCQPPHCVHVRCCQARQSEVMSSKRRRLRIARCERTPLAAGKKALNLPDRNDNNTLATLSTQSWGHTMHKDTRTQAQAA